MSGDPQPSSDFRSLSQEKRVDEACDRFEAAWRSGQQPRIEEYLASADGVERSELLRQLLALEIELRSVVGEQPTTREYEIRFPEHAELIKAAFQQSPRASDSSQSPSQMDPDMTASPGPWTDSRISDSQELKEKARSAETPSGTGNSELCRYELLAEIGRGAMGVVYRARHKALGKQVAVKVLLPGQSLQRFLREAKLLAALHSPYILAVHDFDMLPDGSPMLCMDCVEGMNLLQKVHSLGERPPEHVVIPWMRQVCEGMKTAADQGVIHRDLKPSNILIDANGHIRVADFGLARGQKALGDLSRSGDIMGTPYYMAPEQAEDPASVDTRADIYSFGATFYHLLTGQPPFDGPTAFAILYKHKTDPLISPRAINPDISRRTNDLLERCLAKSPSDRFQSFADLLRQLEPTRLGEQAPFAWDESDDRELACYYAKYRLGRDTYLSGRGFPGVIDRFEFPGGRKLLLVRGNIVEQNVEAIVSSSDYYLSMDAGVSLAIARAGGPKIREEVQGYGKVLPGRAVVTSAGNLRARFVFHGAMLGLVESKPVRPSQDLISQIIASCSYHADSLLVKSIAFPLLGTGALGFSREICLDTMFRNLSRILLRGLTCIKEARVIVFDEPS